MKTMEVLSDGSETISTQVFEHQEGNERHAEIDTLITLFWSLTDYFGFYNNDNTEHNLRMRCSCDDKKQLREDSE